MSAILMHRDYWLNSQLSIARFYGGIEIHGTRYIVIGSEQDLVDERFVKYYNKLGRDKFTQIVLRNRYANKEEVMQIMKDALKDTLKEAKKKQCDNQQTKLDL